jgi:AcrR family transcriptional regulator
MAGRPRSVECDQAILDAALAEYGECGLEAMSVDAVATRAGVSKATIYRRYPSKTELVIAAVSTVVERVAPAPDAGSLRDDLLTAANNMRRMLQHTVVGAAARMLVVDARQHADLGRMHAEFVRRRRNRHFDILRRGIARGELPADLDLEIAADLLIGPLFYRYLVLRKRLSAAYVEQVVDTFLAATSRGSPARAAG